MQELRGRVGLHRCTIYYGDAYSEEEYQQANYIFVKFWPTSVADDTILFIALSLCRKGQPGVDSMFSQLFAIGFVSQKVGIPARA